MPAHADTQALPRRDFLHVASGALIATGGIVATWPFIDSMNPAADTLALASVDVDLSVIAVGERVTIKWRGKPVFIVRRTKTEIAAARHDDEAALVDRETDASRIINQPWLVVIGICTHLGCVPLGQKETDSRGDYGGWFCPCHGSHYDTSGRIRKGPAPRNLDLPPYQFVAADVLRIG
ncbi:ubiquinol-cytochrome c reductase iron-sulfur subunit [Kordiimonas lipolytica]|uniref:Ubiquinol-cytochrome c reductase iron-sulfur subunit n=1 Tax=Kordiimonas lipolytica TaxID=1662421 RepID=A0ABV8U755_9PROT|nr:ubiquinol-cytochrome c reductase iron-sulfur subunit [Kordiimonas lipolytica]